MEYNHPTPLASTHLAPPRRSMSGYTLSSTSNSPSSSRRSSFDSLYPTTTGDRLATPPMISRHLTPPASPSPFMVEFNKRTQLLAQSEPSLGPTKPDTSASRRSGKFLLLVLLPTVAIVTAAVAFATITTSTYRRPLPVQRPLHGAPEWQKRWANDLEVRQNADSADVPILTGGGLGASSSDASPTPTTSASASVSGTATGTLTSTSSSSRASAPAIPSSVVIPTPFPQPFDSTLSTDFTSGTCQVFFANLTTMLNFRQCRPLSLLIPTSQSFIQTQLDKNLTTLTSIIYGTCNTTPSEDECVGRMLGFEQDIRQACAQELAAGHSLAWSALNGFRNYKMVRDAGCLRNERTNSYCFVDAVAAQPPADIYLYQLPMGTALPGSSSSSSASRAQSTTVAKIARNVNVDTTEDTSVPLLAKETEGTFGFNVAKGVQITPSCSACTRSVMSIFASYATNSTLLIHETYPSASRVLNSACGDGYAQSVSGAFSVSSLATAKWNLVLLGAVGVGLAVVL